MASNRYRKLNDKALKRKYDALKQTKSRAKTTEAKAAAQEAIDEALTELDSRGLNAKGTAKKPQGYGKGTHCICSPAELMMGRTRPNCPTHGGG